MTTDLTMPAIEIAVNRCFSQNTKFSVPNVMLNNGHYEADLLIINRSDYVYEVEIKRSISDLKADFKKNHFHNSIFIRKLYYAVTEEIYEKALEYIPDWAGVIKVCGSNDPGFGWAIIKREGKPIQTAKRLSIEDVARFAYLGAIRIWDLKRNNINLTNQIKNIRENQTNGN